MRKRTIEFHPEAILEGREAVRWYAERSSVAAEAFFVEFDKGIERIQVRPLARAEHLSRTRRYLFRRFPYAIVYRVVDTTIQIIAIMHARRRPGYWKTRV